MNVLRVSLLSLAVLALGGLLVNACGGGGSANNPDGGGNGGNGGGNFCQPMGTTTLGSCTQAEITSYQNCVQTACDSQFKTCFGPNYKSGSFSGDCASYIQCTNACGCTDTACQQNCTPSTACTTCEQSFLSCFGSCTIPACAFGGGGTGGSSGGGTGGRAGGGTGGAGGSSAGGGTCSDLLACCNAANATFKPSCMQAYTSAMPLGDATCGQVLAGIKSTICP